MIFTKVTVMIASLAISMVIISCGGGVEKVPEEAISYKFRLPEIRPPMLDGIISDSEWPEAAEFQSKWDRGRIWIGSDPRYVYICVTSLTSKHTGLNLYIDNMGGEIFMLQVSLVLGQRSFSDSRWQKMVWGPTGLWNSNLVQAVPQEGEKVYLIPEAFEFQIDKKLIPTGQFKFMFQFKQPEMLVPESADTLSSDAWLICGQ
jgi:hypothetical protein